MKEAGERTAGKSPEVGVEQHGSCILSHRWVQGGSPLTLTVQGTEMARGPRHHKELCLAAGLVPTLVPPRGLEKKITLAFQRHIIVDA